MMIKTYLAFLFLLIFLSFIPVSIFANADGDTFFLTKYLSVGKQSGMMYIYSDMAPLYTEFRYMINFDSEIDSITEILTQCQDLAKQFKCNSYKYEHNNASIDISFFAYMKCSDLLDSLLTMFPEAIEIVTKSPEMLRPTIPTLLNSMIKAYLRLPSTTMFDSFVPPEEFTLYDHCSNNGHARLLTLNLTNVHVQSCTAAYAYVHACSNGSETNTDRYIKALKNYCDQTEATWLRKKRWISNQCGKIVISWIMKLFGGECPNPNAEKEKRALKKLATMQKMLIECMELQNNINDVMAACINDLSATFTSAIKQIEQQ